MSLDLQTLEWGALVAPPVLAGAAGSWVVGVTGSVHCLLMCGPLACAALPGVAGQERRWAMVGYQGARVAAYTLVGGVLGALGGGVMQALAVSARGWVPWVMAAALVASALELGKRLKPLPGVSRVVSAVARVSAKFSSAGRASAMGAVTPLLPCGLLYGVYAAAMAGGSFTAGALIAGAFALGAVPALLGAQLQAGLWQRKPWLTTWVLQRALPLTAAAVLVYRAINASSAPSCH